MRQRRFEKNTDRILKFALSGEVLPSSSKFLCDMGIYDGSPSSISGFLNILCSNKLLRRESFVENQSKKLKYFITEEGIRLVRISCYREKDGSENLARDRGEAQN